MRLKKGMRKALSLALSTALIITSANIGSIKSKAAEADKNVFDTAVTTKEYWTENEAKKVVTGAGIFVDVDALKEAGKEMDQPTLEVTTQKKKNTADYYGGFNYGVSEKGNLGNQKTKGDYAYKKWTGSLSENVKNINEKYLVLALPDRYVDGTLDYSFKLYDASYAPIDDSKIPSEVVIKKGETAKIAVKTAGNATFDSNAYAKTKHEDLGIEDWKALAGVNTTYDAETGLISIATTDECKAVGLDDTELFISFELPNGAKIQKWIPLKIVEDGTTTTAEAPGKSESKGVVTNYSKTLSYDASKVEKAPVVAEDTQAPAVSTEPSSTPTNGATTAPTNGATTVPTNGATTAPTNGATTAPTSAATNTPAPVSTNTPAPTSDATPAPTEAPKGNMDKFNVAFNYVADDKWGEQSWGDKSVDVTGDGKYEISYTAQSDTTDIFMMILSTDLYKGSLNKDFKLVPTTVSVGKTDYKVNAKGGWCFADQEETNAYRYNIVNPYNGPIGSDGVTYVDPAVTSIDGLGTVPVKKGDTIKVSFTVSGMKGSTSAKSKAKVTVSKKTVTVAAGKSTTVSYKALNKAGKAVKASAKTSNKKLATVKVTSSKKIKISVPKKATKGSSAKITLTSAGKKATITVKVANPVKSAKAAKKTVKIKKGKKAKITVKVTAQNKKKATTDKLTAKSSKSKIAKITGKKVSKGKVTVTVKGAKKGTSKLTIKIGKKSVKVTVKVK